MLKDTCLYRQARYLPIQAPSLNVHTGHTLGSLIARSSPRNVSVVSLHDGAQEPEQSGYHLGIVQVGAESAQVGAESAQVGAESAQVGAESAQVGTNRDKSLLRRNKSGVSRHEVGVKS